MAVESHPILAREGWIHILVTVAIAGLVHTVWGWAWASPFWLATLFVLQFFRDPARSAPEDVDAVVAPADGKVVFVGTAEDPYLDRTAIKISIFMNVFSVHSNRSPIGGKVMQRWYHPGRFINAVLDKASRENERNAIWLQSKWGMDVVCVQVAGLIARRILCYLQPGDSVTAAQRYGFIRFGSRVDIYLPEHSEIKTHLGDTVHGGSDVIGALPRGV